MGPAAPGPENTPAQQPAAPEAAAPESAEPEAAAPEAAAPEAESTEAEPAETETAPATATVPAANTGGRPRRRAATLEARVAARKSAPAEGDTPAAPATATRKTRATASAPVRTGLRAQQRAAKAALAYAQSAAAMPDPDQQPAIRQDMSDRPPPHALHPQTAAHPQPALPPQPDLHLQAALPPQASLRPQQSAPVESGVSTALAPVAWAPGLPVIERPPGDLISVDDQSDDDRPFAPGNRRRMTTRLEKRQAKNNDAAHYVVGPTVGPAQMRPRHYGVIALFLLMVLLPTISYGWYMWTKAADQYESNVGFGSRTEDAPATFDFLGALGGASQTGAKDMDILSQFIISQELVAKLDSQLDLKAIFAKPANDPMHAFTPGGTIEDLVAFWQRMVIVNYDNATGLMTLQVFAFTPQDAKRIAEVILVESTSIINDLSMTAQEDTTRYSKDALTTAETKLGDARLAVLDYQVRNNIVDPTNVIASQNGVIGTLNQQLATAQIELDMLAGTVGKSDVRINTLNRRIEVIQNRVREEQAKVGAGDATSPGFAQLMQEFGRLQVDQDFAERAYLAALAAYDQAINDAQHKTRYLAAYLTPTLAEAPTAPDRPLNALIAALVGFLLWAISVLLYYALRDRR